MLKYLKKYWKWCLIAPLFMLGEISMDLLQPDLMARVVDDGVLAGNMDVIIGTGLRMILTVILGGLSGILCGVFANLAAQNFANDLRKDLFRKIMSLSFGQTDKISTGSLVTRLSNDVSQVERMVMMSVRGAVRSTVMFLGGIVMLFMQGVSFAVIALCALPFVVGATVFFLKKASPMFTVVQKKLDGVNNIMQENIAGARVVKAYVSEEHEISRFDKANDELCDTNLRVQNLLAFMMPIMNIILNVCVVCILVVGGKLTAAGESGLQPGRIMAAITYMAMILHGVTFMSNIFQTFTRAGASVDRIKEVLACEQLMPDGAQTAKEGMRGEVEFKNVSFAYPNGGGTPVLEDVSLRVRRGETLAIIGATGCGKSTLVNLIPRFYDVTAGSVLVDGTDVRDYGKEDLRSRVAIVLQRAELYSRSIEANIRWGKPEADEWEIKGAAEVSQADEFVCRNANGYYTQVTEGGHSMSGGQKQRVSIARAVLKDAEILILDDSTSALDLRTEAEFRRALAKRCPDTIKIIIAQRIASVKDSDRIAVLDKGRVTAVGTHEELLKISDIYRDICESQLKGGSADE